MHADGHFVIPVVMQEGAEMTYSFRGINTNDGNIWNVVFTSQKEFEKGQPSQVISHFIDAALKACVDASEAEGFIVNPWSDDAFMLSRDLIRIILDADEGVEDIGSRIALKGGKLLRIKDVVLDRLIAEIPVLDRGQRHLSRGIRRVGCECREGADDAAAAEGVRSALHGDPAGGG